uniref:Bm12885 n=1 Tax=Brugia malayi TaxID=6279 RepID=A0A0I9NAC7_BRUMA|nr:Bm12885 [Brugia malayi]
MGGCGQWHLKTEVNEVSETWHFKAESPQNLLEASNEQKQQDNTLGDDGDRWWIQCSVMEPRGNIGPTGGDGQYYSHSFRAIRLGHMTSGFIADRVEDREKEKEREREKGRGRGIRLVISQ